MKCGLKRASFTAGFTIVETMIVLAVTGLLFVAIVTTWAGKQHANEFNDAAQEVTSQIQQVISQVQAGYFPSAQNFTCAPSGGGIALHAGSTAQGQNDGCVFLGKVLQFSIHGTDPEQFKSYSLAGLRQPASAAPTIADTKPRVLAPDNTSATSGMTDISEESKLLYGLTTTSIQVNTSTGVYQHVGAIGFLSRVGTYSAGNLNSGTQQIDLYGLKNTTLNADVAQVPGKINTALSSSTTFFVNKPTYICFKSGGTNKYALVSIGQGNSNLAVDLTITDGANPRCI